jgi:hypothetical protein
MTTEEWILLVVLGVAVVAVIIGATAAATSHSQAKQSQQRDLNRQLDDVTGGAQWVEDQSLSVLQVTDPTQIQDSWNTVRSYTVDLEGRVSALGSGTGDPSLDSALDNLGRCLAGLRTALQSYVSAKTAPSSANQDQVVNAALQTVMARRQSLDGAVQSVKGWRQ